MRQPISLVFLVAFFAGACARTALAPQSTQAAKVERSSAPNTLEKVTTAAAETTGPRRTVGDFWVHRISGSFSERPMLLMERVVAEKDATFQVEYTLEDALGATRLLVARDAKSDEIVSVTRMVDGAETAGTVADYDAFMARTSIAPDSNEGFLDRTLGTCTVGPSELDCETKSYRITIGDESATLDVTHSDKYPGRDIAGEISSEDGQVIYRAELIEAGHEGDDATSFAAR